jgi:hypothetical protein
MSVSDSELCCPGFEAYLDYLSALCRSKVGWLKPSRSHEHPLASASQGEQPSGNDRQRNMVSDGRIQLNKEF